VSIAELTTLVERAIGGLTGPTGQTLLAVLIIVGVIVGVVLGLVTSARRRKALQRHRVLEMQHELERFVEHAEQGLTPVSTHLILQKDAYAVLEESSALFETRAYRVYGGAGTRIKGIYIGGGASESHQRLREIDTGTLTLTTKRLIFDGTHENRNVRLSDLLSVSIPWSDAIEVSSQKRAKSQVFRVRNPLIWTTIVRSVAAGKFSKRERVEEP